MWQPSAEACPYGLTRVSIHQNFSKPRPVSLPMLQLIPQAFYVAEDIIQGWTSA